jgi:hypothetical protein
VIGSEQDGDDLDSQESHWASALATASHIWVSHGPENTEQRGIGTASKTRQCKESSQAEPPAKAAVRSVAVFYSLNDFLTTSAGSLSTWNSGSVSLNYYFFSAYSSAASTRTQSKFDSCVDLSQSRSFRSTIWSIHNNILSTATACFYLCLLSYSNAVNSAPSLCSLPADKQ